MSSSRVDGNDTGGEDSLRHLSKGNSSTERIQAQFKSYKFNTREESPSPNRRGRSPITNNMSAPQRTTQSHRRKAVRSTISSRETSPSRPNLSSAARGSQLHNNITLSQQASEGPLSPRFKRPSSSTTPQWPNSPRLGAGPKTPQRSPALSPRKTIEQVVPPPLAPSALQLRVETVSKNINSDDTDLELPPPGMRTPRANSSPALETVEESSLPSTPAIGTSRILAQKVAVVEATRNQEKSQGRIIETTDGETTGGESTTPTVPRSTIGSRVPTFGSNVESESESGFASEDRIGYNPPRDASSAGPSRVFTRRPTLVNTLQMNPDTSRNMTVETETVTSMIQLGGGSGGVNPSIRPKKSSDTIRAPRKEKKKRPTTIANPNPASTKAEFFGARVAAAVHEADSSDSDETFVYESNPPDQRPTAKFHSRTPSTSSVHGAIHGGPDPRVRNFSLDQPGPSVTRNKMHKFGGKSDTASLYGGDDNGGNGNGYGTVGGPAGPSRNDYGGSRNGATSRNSNHGHRSILPDDSPFASEPRTSPHALRNPAMSHIGSKSLTGQSTRTHIRSGRNGMNGGGDGAGSKRNSRNFERERRYGTAEEGDDERVPLLHPAPRHERDRNTRNRHRRPMSASLRQLEHNELRRRGWIGRCAGCIIAVMTIIMVLTGTVGFMFATSKPLEDVKVLNMTDVLVSQQEIMLDLVVQAMNPNMIGVTVQTMDVNLFAKSAWIRDDKDKGPSDGDPGEGDESKIRKPRPPPSGSTKHRQEKAELAGLGDWFPGGGGRKGVDEGTDPDPNLPDQEDKQTMLLGSILTFDSPLNFDASPLQHYPTISKGSMRLAQPGNKTAKGVKERWERVVLHPFELIVRGVLKYQTPLSGRWRTASIGASVMVNPADDNLEVPIEMPVDE
ncbi:vacuolar segregation subunit 7-domain-containing protein [Tirmania nivea]|nr:vacuolar segregation subunit 7-domain-containing protein [Tirmania nivea]